jgi:hypothetical protein
MDSDDTSSHMQSVLDSIKGGNEAFNLLDISVLWIHKHLKEILAYAGGSSL